MEDIARQLKNGVVLAELGGYSDGKFCALHGKGSAMVMLGTFIVSSGKVDYPRDFVFMPGRDSYFSYLKHNIGEAGKSGAKTGVSVVSIQDDDNIDFLLAAGEAGADYVSYCAHSTMRIFMETGTSSAMLLRKNWKALERLTSRLLKKITVPLIFKIGAFDNEDIADSIGFLKDLGVRIFHINIIDNLPHSKGIGFLYGLKKEGLFIIAGGGINDIDGAKRILEHGADAVAIGNAAIRDPGICRRIQDGLQARENDY